MFSSLYVCLLRRVRRPAIGVVELAKQLYADAGVAFMSWRLREVSTWFLHCSWFHFKQAKRWTATLCAVQLYFAQCNLSKIFIGGHAYKLSIQAFVTACLKHIDADMLITCTACRMTTPCKPPPQVPL